MSRPDRIPGKGAQIFVWSIAPAAGGLIALATYLAITLNPGGSPYPGSNSWLFRHDPEWTKHLLLLLVLITGLVGLVILKFYDRLHTLGREVIGCYARRPVAFLASLSVVFVILLGFFAVFVLQEFPNSADEYAYIFEARTLAQGRVYNQPHPAHDHFLMYHMAPKDGKWLPRFPPGWSLLLAGGLILHLPLWLVNPLLAVFSFWVLFWLGDRLYGRTTAVVAVILYAFSAFFVFNSASFFAHTSCALLILIAIYCGLRHVEDRSVGFALAAGFAIGLAFLTRYYTAVILSLPFLVWLIAREKGRAVRSVGWIVLGSLPWLAGGMWYNWVVTGNPVIPPFLWHNNHPAYVKTDLLLINLHTIAMTISYLARMVVWTAPPMLFLYGWFLLAGLARRKVDFVDFMFLTAVVCHVWYGAYAGNQYGPRYYYEAYPFFLLAVVSRLFNPERLLLSPTAKKVSLALIAAGLVVAGGALALHARAEHRVIWERTDLYRQVKERGIDNAVIFIRSSTGAIRNMSRLDLARNGIKISGPVIYALDFGADNQVIMDYFPGRKYYRYVRRPDQAMGRLVEIPAR